MMVKLAWMLDRALSVAVMVMMAVPGEPMGASDRTLLASKEKVVTASPVRLME